MWFPMDQATVLMYAAGYVAAVVAAFLIYLPLLLGVVLMLAVTGVMSLVVVLVKAVTVGLFRLLARGFRSIAAHLHGVPGGHGLAPR
jgi:hypothetical protein